MGVSHSDEIHTELAELFGKYHVHDSLAPGPPAHNGYVQWLTLFHHYSLSNNLSWMLSNPPIRRGAKVVDFTSGIFEKVVDIYLYPHPFAGICSNTKIRGESKA
jgi:hypothetical protein